MRDFFHGSGDGRGLSGEFFPGCGLPLPAAMAVRGSAAVGDRRAQMWGLVSNTGKLKVVRLDCLRREGVRSGFLAASHGRSAPSLSR